MVFPPKKKGDFRGVSLPEGTACSENKLYTTQKMPILGRNFLWLNIKFGGPPGINEVVYRDFVQWKSCFFLPANTGVSWKFSLPILGLEHTGTLWPFLWIFTSKQLVYPDIRQKNISYGFSRTHIWVLPEKPSLPGTKSAPSICSKTQDDPSRFNHLRWQTR